MGASKVIRERRCPVCEGVAKVDANGLREHAAVCRRMKAAGLVMPQSTILVPPEQPKQQPTLVIP